LKVSAPDPIGAINPDIPGPSLEGCPEGIINRVFRILGDEQPTIALTADVGPLSSRSVEAEHWLSDVEDRIHALPERAAPLPVLGNEEGVRNAWILDIGLPMLDFVVHPGNSGNDGFSQGSRITTA
jgi:hypothetical protein